MKDKALTMCTLFFLQEAVGEARLPEVASRVCLNTVLLGDAAAHTQLQCASVCEGRTRHQDGLETRNEHMQQMHTAVAFRLPLPASIPMLAVRLN
jgi:hypothetical protein